MDGSPVTYHGLLAYGRDALASDLRTIISEAVSTPTRVSRIASVSLSPQGYIDCHHLNFVVIVPLVGSFSRGLVTAPGSAVMRDIRHPTGRTDVGQAALAQVAKENDAIEFSVALFCHAARLHLPALLLFPERLGGDGNRVPASLWDHMDLHRAFDAGVAFTAAAYACDLTG